MAVRYKRGVLLVTLLNRVFTLSTAAFVGTFSIPAHSQQARTADVGWPMYNQTYDARRFSALDQINTSNVAGLKETCRQRVGDLGGFGGSPIVVNGVMYVTFANATLAMNPIDCAIYWKALHLQPGARAGGVSNRGVAFDDGKLYRGIGDGAVVALDAGTGRELWRTQVADTSLGEGVPAAPTVWDGKLMIGISGSEVGVRGKVMALNTQDGAILWKFNTVPQAGEFGSDTWKGTSYLTGGGGTWSASTLDPDTGEIFFPIGNPAPDFMLAPRVAKRKIGVNLFTNSVLGLDARTGKLNWYFQSTPSDDRDLDQASAPMLFKLADGRSVMAAASKDGYLRVIDRATRKVVYKVAITTIKDETKPITVKGQVACPGTLGGNQWNGPAYDQANGALIVGAVDWCSLLQLDETVEYKKATPFYGGRMTNVMNPPPSGWITSVDAEKGTVRWKFHAPAPVTAAITPTAGGVTFAGDVAGTFYALRSSDGEVLFKTPTAGSIAGGIITYTVAGRQYVAITSGNLSRTMWVGAGLPHIVIYTVGDVAPDAALAARGTRLDVERGGGQFIRVCAACHGFGGTGGTGPALKGVGKKLSAIELAGQIRSPRPTNAGAASMPAFTPDILDDQAVADVVAFLETL